MKSATATQPTVYVRNLTESPIVMVDKLAPLSWYIEKWMLEGSRITPVPADRWEAWKEQSWLGKYATESGALIEVSEAEYASQKPTALELRIAEEARLDEEEREEFMHSPQAQIARLL